MITMATPSPSEVGTPRALPRSMTLQSTLERLMFWKKSKRARRAAERGTSLIASVVRAGNGSRVHGTGARPEKRLVLYEMENCPHSRQVREALSMLDLDADVRPCPHGEKRHRGELTEIGGKEQIPLLVDPNTMAVVYESGAIIDYLYEHYGVRRPPLALSLRPLAELTSKLASAIRAESGERYVPAVRPERPLELYSHEASSESRLVREALSAHALPYVLLNVARGSHKERALHDRSEGRGVPFLVDPNRGVELHGAGNIRAYLRDTYARRVERPETLSERSPTSPHPRPA